MVVVVCGDSNAHLGKYADETGVDRAGSGIFQYKRDGSVVAADESIDNSGINSNYDGTGHGAVGSTVALCRLLRDRGKVPSGYSILVVPHAWAGTPFAGYWATTGNRYALDGGGGHSPGFYAHVAAALATHADNRVWFFDWNHGCNDAGQTQSQYQNNMIATWGEIRSTVTNGAVWAPILVAGCPPDRSNPSLGGANLSGVIAAQQNVGNILANAAYVDPAGLHSDPTNAYIHYHAAAHRGGVVSSSYFYGVQPTPAVDEGQTVTNPLSERKYAALLNLGWRMRATWT